MSYVSWSVVYGEQPSAAKWNILGSNDASFNDGTGIADGVITSEALNATIACRAYLSAAQNIQATTKVLLDTENYDLGSDFDTTNSRFVAPVTGYYQVNASLLMNNVDAISNQVITSIYVNGALYSFSKGYIPAANDDPSATIADLVPATAGQYIELYGFCTTTNAVNNASTSTYMSIHFIGV